jgi:hypothetical protein
MAGFLIILRLHLCGREFRIKAAAGVKRRFEAILSDSSGRYSAIQTNSKRSHAVRAYSRPIGTVSGMCIRKTQVR